LKGYEADAIALSDRMGLLMIVVAAIGLIAGLAAAFWIGVSLISRPLVRVTGTLQKMAGGDLAVDVDKKRSKDEIGAIWATTDQFLVKLRDAERAASRWRSPPGRDRQAPGHARSRQFLR
jgi:methyl-accepting chemotaxis protein